jgi:hypothetical protein
MKRFEDAYARLGKVDAIIAAATADPTPLNAAT